MPELVAIDESEVIDTVKGDDGITVPTGVPIWTLTVTAYMV